MLPYYYTQQLKKLDADNASIPVAGEVKITPCHEKPKTPFEHFTESRNPGLASPHAVRRCNACGMIQDESRTVNSPCEKCGNDVVMTIPKLEAPYGQ